MNLATLMAARDRAGADYALAAHAVASAALDMKALDLAIATAAVGGASNGPFPLEALSVPSHPVYLPETPTAGDIAGAGVIAHRNRLLASYGVSLTDTAAG